jgi:uncharacterized protein
VNIVQPCVDFLMGAALGFLGGLFGVGGGIIAIPVLALAYGMDQHLAQGTALVMVVPNVMIGFWRYYRRGGLDVRYAITLGLSAVVFTYIAAEVAIGLHAEALRLYFALFILLMAFFMIRQAVKDGAKNNPNRDAEKRVEAAHPHWTLASIVGAIGGALSGLFGVGGATIAPPMLTAWYGFTQASAQGLALALVAPGAIVGLVTYAKSDAVDWSHGIPLAVGSMLSVSAGVSLAYKLSNRRLKLIFCVMLLAAAIAMITSMRA